MREPLRVVTAGKLPAAFPLSDFASQIDLKVASTDEELRTLVRSADVLYSWQIPDIVPAETPDLRWIEVPSAGVDHLHHLPVWQSDVTITASQGIHTIPMAEHLFAMLLALERQLPAVITAQERREWVHNWGRGRFGELRGKTMGIIGWGKIGDGVAHLARAFGMRVVGTRWSIIVPREVPRQDTFAFENPPWLEPLDLPPDILYPAAQLHEVLAQSDVVVVLLPLTQQSRHLIGREEFRTMKRGALLLNIGRGEVIDQEAMILALQTGRLAGAGLDVFEPEPLPRSSPLWSMPNVIVSPHVGGMSEHTRDRAVLLFAVNLARYLDGAPLINLVDREREY